MDGRGAGREKASVIGARMLRCGGDELEMHPFNVTGPIEEVAPSVFFLPHMANVTILHGPEGLLFIDSGGVSSATEIYGMVRKKWPDTSVHTCIYTELCMFKLPGIADEITRHGHLDHVFGIRVFEKNDERKSRVIAHVNVAKRFERYNATRGYNARINFRQFAPEISVPTTAGWPRKWRKPDITYHDSMSLEFGGFTVHLNHARGETDDATWVWIPEARTVCTGDLFIWAAPNCGNPQKVQRYAEEWARALESMANLRPHILLPGHGPPIIGEEHVIRALSETAEFLNSIVQQAMALINAGYTRNEVVHRVVPPSHLLNRPYLKAVYDEPAFIVNNIWRLYAGWWSGSGAELKPAKSSALGQELVKLGGGVDRVCARARELSKEGSEESLALAAHLAQLALDGHPTNETACRTYSEVFRTRSQREASLMARNIFLSCAVKAEGGGTAEDPQARL